MCSPASSQTPTGACTANGENIAHRHSQGVSKVGEVKDLQFVNKNAVGLTDIFALTSPPETTSEKAGNFHSPPYRLAGYHAGL